MTTATAYSNLVQDLYVAYFGRPADYFGLQNFEAALAAANVPTTAEGLSAAYSSNTAVKTLVDSFGTSAESQALYGGGTTAAFVNAIFENLFNRPAAVIGLNFWVNAIDSGSTTAGGAALAILAGAFANTTDQGKADQNTINNKVTVAGTFTADLGASSNSIVAYHGADAAAAARLLLAGVNNTTNTATYDVGSTITNIVNNNNSNTYTLTTGVDTIVGGAGNDVFNATLGGSAPTLQSFDSITGGTLSNTLNITDFGSGGTMAFPSGATFNGITTLNINSLESVESDFSTWGTLTSLNIKSATGGIELDAPGNAAVNVTNNGSGDISVIGGSSVTVNQNATAGQVFVETGPGATTLTINGGSSIHGQDANWGNAGQTLADVSLSNVGSGGATLYSDALVSLTVSNSSTGTVKIDTDDLAGTRTLNVTLTGDTGIEVKDNQASTITVNATTTASQYDAISSISATALVINNNVDASYEIFQTPDVKNVTVTGTGEFDISYLLLAANAVLDASGSSGKIQAVMASAWGADPTQSFIGGAGQDIVAIGSDQTGTITGGSAHNNEILIAGIGDPESVTEAALTTVTNFQVLGVTGTLYGSFDMANLKGQAYTGFEVGDETTGNVTFKNVTPSNDLTLTLSGNNTYTVELDTADKAGASETVNLVLGDQYGPTSTSQVTLSDAAQDGIGTINLSAAGIHSTDVNDIGTLADSGVSIFNVSGNAQAQIDELEMSGASLTVNNSAVWFGFEDLNAPSLSTLTFAGTGDDFIENLETSATTLAITNNGTGSVIIDTLNAVDLKSATFTQSAGSHDMSVSTLDSLALPLASLTLNGNVAVYIGDDTVTTGVTITGGTDDAAVTFTGAGASVSGATDSVTLGNGDDTIFFNGGSTDATQTVVLGNGTDDVVSLTTGTFNVTVGNGDDTISGYGANNFHVNAGNGNNAILEATAGATIAIKTGTGANNIIVTEGDSGTITVGAHSASTADVITVGVSGTGAASTPMIVIGGLNNGSNGSGVDQIVFSGDSGNAIAGVVSLTADQVRTAGGDTTSLAAWVATADSATLNAPAHSIVTFQFQGNTYLLETEQGGSADAGGAVAGNTLVELLGLGYTFSHTGLGQVGGHGAITLMG